MAVFGSLATVRAQLAGSPAFLAAFDYVARCLDASTAEHRRVQAVPVDTSERVELGDGMFALEQAYRAKPPADGRWESHRAYIDVQVIVAGEERMELADVRDLRVAEDFTPGRDVLFYHASDAGSSLRATAGAVAVFFPVDGHKPSLALDPAAPALVRKTVVKVPVALAAGPA